LDFLAFSRLFDFSNNNISFFILD